MIPQLRPNRVHSFLRATLRIFFTRCLSQPDLAVDVHQTNESAHLEPDPLNLRAVLNKEYIGFILFN